MTRSLKPQVSSLKPLLISAIPWAWLRTRAYALLCGYRIGRGARIGFLAVLDCASAEIGPGAVIGRFCRFIAVGKLSLGANVEIGRSCRFHFLQEVEIGQGTRLQAFSNFLGAPWDRAGRIAHLRIGKDCYICGLMHFDMMRDITVGDNVFIAGMRSEFWTHGLAAEKNLPIRIGNRCYLGSGVMIGPGTTVADECVVGMGSVLQGDFDEPDCLIVGSRAQVVKRGYLSGLLDKAAREDKSFPQVHM